MKWPWPLAIERLPAHLAAESLCLIQFASGLMDFHRRSYEPQKFLMHALSSTPCSANTSARLIRWSGAEFCKI